MNLSERTQSILQNLDDHAIGVAFSGGSDSTALLKSIHEHCDAKINVHALYIQHHAKDEKSCLAECAFVTRFCHEHEINLVTIELPKDLAHDEGTLREWRYQKLAQAGCDLKLEWIALAHHREDQSETWLMRLLRGADLRGLCGMPNEFVRHGQKFVRPWLGVSKTEIQAWRTQRGIDCYQDPTNAENHYRRNELRNKLIPEIEKYQPLWSEKIEQVTKTLDELFSWRNEEYQKHELNLDSHFNDEDELQFPREILQQAPYVLVKEWSYRTISHFNPETSHRVTRKHIENLASFVQSEELGYFPENLPGRLQIRGRKREIIVRQLPEVK